MGIVRFTLKARRTLMLGTLMLSAVFGLYSNIAWAIRDDCLSGFLEAVESPNNTEVSSNQALRDWVATNKKKGRRRFRLLETDVEDLMQNLQRGDILEVRVRNGKSERYIFQSQGPNGGVIMRRESSGKDILFTKSQFEARKARSTLWGERAESRAADLETQLKDAYIRAKRVMQSILVPSAEDHRRFAEAAVALLNHTGVRAEAACGTTCKVYILTLSPKERAEGWQGRAELTQIADRIGKHGYRLAMDTQNILRSSKIEGYVSDQDHIVVIAWWDVLSIKPSATTLHELHHFARARENNGSSSSRNFPPRIKLLSKDGLAGLSSVYQKVHFPEELGANVKVAKKIANNAKRALEKYEASGSRQDLAALQFLLESLNQSLILAKPFAEVDLPLLRNAVIEVERMDPDARYFKGKQLSVDLKDGIQILFSSKTMSPDATAGEVAEALRENITELEDREDRMSEIERLRDEITSRSQAREKGAAR